MDLNNVIQFPVNEVQSFIDAGEGLCSFCFGSKLKADHRKRYDLRCLDCGHEFDMHDAEAAMVKQRRIDSWEDSWQDYER